MNLSKVLESFYFTHPVPTNMNPVDAATHYHNMTTELAPVLERSYNTLTMYLLAQYDALTRAGYTFDFISGDGYFNSRHMFETVTETKHLVVRKSLGDNYTDIEPDHPMAREVLTTDGVMLLNDVFRAVHDILGHYAIRASFGQDGEAMAWLHHRSLLPGSAHQALWCETRGQNTWTNFWDDHQSLPNRERPFAVQKFGSVPVELI